MYHYIRKFDKALPFQNFLHIESFKKQIEYLKSQKKIMELNSKIADSYHKNRYLLTFDDGFKEHLQIARYLKKKKLLGVFFIPSLPLKKKTFLPIHKIHLLFARYNSSEILKIFERFKILENVKEDKKIFSLFKKQKKHIANSKSSEVKKKTILKTILNNCDQDNYKIVDKIFNYCFTKKIQKIIFDKFYLTKKDILQIKKLGMVIGAHSDTHRVLAKLNSKLQFKELAASCQELEKIIKEKIIFFAYPYGGFEVFNASTIKILKKMKIKYCFNVESKNWSKLSNKLYIPRYDCNEFKFGKIFNYKNLINKQKNYISNYIKS